MSLLKKPKSVLDHGGATHLAMASTLATRTDHHEAEHDHLYAGVGYDDLPERHLNFFPERTPGKRPEPTDEMYPRHVHSTSVTGESFTVNTEEDHKLALDSGEWSDIPLEVTKEK